MSRVLSEDAVRRAFADKEPEPLEKWQREHLLRSVEPVLQEPWICDIDVTIKTIYGRQEGAEVGYNPHKPRAAGARLSHFFHFAFAAGFGCGGGTGQTISRPGGAGNILAVVGAFVGGATASSAAGRLRLWQGALHGGMRKPAAPTELSVLLAPEPGLSALDRETQPPGRMEIAAAAGFKQPGTQEVYTSTAVFGITACLSVMLKKTISLPREEQVRAK